MTDDGGYTSARVRDLLRGVHHDDAALRENVRAELRSRMRALRRLVPTSVLTERSATICGWLDTLPGVAEASVVMGYSPIRNEIDPTAWLDKLAARGVTVALPRIDEDGQLHVVRRDGGLLLPDRFGVPAPDAEGEVIAPARLDVVLVPALAVDERGHRLGYGRGYYDRLLATLPQATSVALVHPFQLLPELADMPHDVPVSWIATERGLIATRRE